MRCRLKAKNVETQIAEQVIAYFKRIGLVNDREYALSWINSRLRKPLGLEAIEIELKRRGINREITRELIAQAKRNINETEIARELAKKQLARLTKNNEPVEKNKGKLFTFLIRRGFPSETVSDIINELSD